MAQTRTLKCSNMWSDHHRRLNSTQFIIDWIPFLLPNQQQQSIEGNSNTSKCAKADFTWTKYGTDSQKKKNFYWCFRSYLFHGKIPRLLHPIFQTFLGPRPLSGTFRYGKFWVLTSMTPEHWQKSFKKRLLEIKQLNTGTYRNGCLDRRNGDQRELQWVQG